MKQLPVILLLIALMLLTGCDVLKNANVRREEAYNNVVSMIKNHKDIPLFDFLTVRTDATSAHHGRYWVHETLKKKGLTDEEVNHFFNDTVFVVRFARYRRPLRNKTGPFREGPFRFVNTNIKPRTFEDFSPRSHIKFGNIRRPTGC